MKQIYIALALLLMFPVLGISQTLESINKVILEGLDEVTPFNEGLAAVRKGNQWGFIDQEGKVVIEFRDDLVWTKNADTNYSGVAGIQYPRFKEGRCVVKQLKEEDIPYYGFIDKTGKLVIDYDYLNITEFDQGNAIGIFVKKTFRGKNEFQLNIYDYVFTEVVVNTIGEIIWPIMERDNIFMSKRRYQLPELRAKLLTQDLLSVKNRDDHWEIVKLEL